MDAVAEIDAIVRPALTSLAEELRKGVWTGQREREVVSLFCFGHLLRHCRPSSVLAHPTQIGVEVAVPQIAGQQMLTGKSVRKQQVCKDIVIWRTPGGTCWDADGKPMVHPLRVLEWKHNEDAVSRYDVRWLRAYSVMVQDFVSYAICTKWPTGAFTLACDRVYRGEVHQNWLRLA